MEQVLLAVKADLNNSLNAGRYLLASFFLVAVFINYVGLLSRNVNWAEVVVRLAIGFVLLQNYTWIMDTSRNIVISVDEMVNPNQDFASQYAAMSDNNWKLHQASSQPSIISNIKFMFSSAIFHNFIINVSFAFYYVLAKVMEAVRYSMVSILYKMGPVLIPLILFGSGAKIVKGWFTSYVSVLCWPILWHIALGVAVSLSAVNHSVEQFACINFAVCFILLISPLIVNSIVAGMGVGSASALGGIMSSRGAVNFMQTAAGVGVALAAAKVVGPLMERFMPSKTPTTADGKFKDAMLGDSKDKEKKS